MNRLGRAALEIGLAVALGGGAVPLLVFLLVEVLGG